MYTLTKTLAWAFLAIGLYSIAMVVLIALDTYAVDPPFLTGNYYDMLGGWLPQSMGVDLTDQPSDMLVWVGVSLLSFLITVVGALATALFRRQVDRYELGEQVIDRYFSFDAARTLNDHLKLLNEQRPKLRMEKDGVYAVLSDLTDVLEGSRTSFRTLGNAEENVAKVRGLIAERYLAYTEELARVWQLEVDVSAAVKDAEELISLSTLYRDLRDKLNDLQAKLDELSVLEENVIETLHQTGDPATVVARVEKVQQDLQSLETMIETLRHPTNGDHIEDVITEARTQLEDNDPSDLSGYWKDLTKVDDELQQAFAAVAEIGTLAQTRIRLTEQAES
ncbi:MAG: hypothetical protein KC877_04600 [Candidatus Kaiserbacteria bacterium]|nr:hypothetical protein [Candidatus Kaiserbacteria bacterium]